MLRPYKPARSAKAGGFTLIELLIVVAIIAILAAIAVPNFLEAQTRARVSRATADMRTLATAIESYRIDNGDYPEGTDNKDNYPPEIGDFMGALAPGYYTFRTRDGVNNLTVGTDFFGITTPISYISSIPLDVFGGPTAGRITYSYRNAKDTRDGWILTSVGPDSDLLAPGGIGSDPANTNPLSTAQDGNSPARIGDINEREFVHFIEGTGNTPVELRQQMNMFLEDLKYDPTNGSVSQGDLYRFMGVPR